MEGPETIALQVHLKSHKQNRSQIPRDMVRALVRFESIGERSDIAYLGSLFEMFLFFLILFDDCFYHDSVVI